MPEEEDESATYAASRHALAETWQHAHALPNTCPHLPKTWPHAHTHMAKTWQLWHTEYDRTSDSHHIGSIMLSEVRVGGYAAETPACYANHMSLSLSLSQQLPVLCLHLLSTTSSTLSLLRSILASPHASSTSSTCTCTHAKKFNTLKASMGCFMSCLMHGNAGRKSVLLHAQ